MTNKHTVNYTILGGVFLLTFASLTLTGCSTEPERVEADYGNSVHQMVQASTYNPEAAASTESIPVYGMDGKRAMNTLDAMTTDTEQRVEDFNNILDFVELGNN